MKSRIALFLSLLLVLCMCYACEAPGVGSISSVNGPDEYGVYTCTYQGVTRKFMLYCPEEVGAGAPLIMMLHTHGGTGLTFAQSSGMNASAREHGYVLAYPYGKPDPTISNSPADWNCGVKDYNIDDVGYVTALAKYLQLTYGFSKENTFAAGYGSGAYMAYRLAANSPDTFRAIASVAGTMTGRAWEERSEKTTVGVLQINGTKDQVLPLNSTLSSKQFGSAPPLDGIIEYWISANGLDVHEEVTLSELTTAQCYSSAKSDTLVWHVEIQDGRHSWPSEQFSGIIVNDVILDYFSRYVKK